jgi:hypothetical protein
MPDPLPILGWLVIGYILLQVILRLLTAALTASEYVAPHIRGYIKHLKTRNTPPATGQMWYFVRGKSYDWYSIINVVGDVVVLKSGNASWGRTKKEWQKSIRRSHMYLLGGTK